MATCIAWPWSARYDTKILRLVLVVVVFRPGSIRTYVEVGRIRSTILLETAYQLVNNSMT